jgi:hypothetical protein
MKVSRNLALAAAVLCLGTGAAMAQQKASLAECTILLEPFKKESAAVKDADVEEYAPLVQAYWEKGCPASLYQEQIKDAALRQRIEAKVPAKKG